jgi:hypothetical protein
MLQQHERSRVHSARGSGRGSSGSERADAAERAERAAADSCGRADADRHRRQRRSGRIRTAAGARADYACS